MKLKIDGIDVECTPKEFLALRKELGVQKEVETKVAEIKNVVKQIHDVHKEEKAPRVLNTWTTEETEKLKEIYAAPRAGQLMSDLKKALPARSTSACVQKAHQLGLTSENNMVAARQARTKEPRIVQDPRESEEAPEIHVVEEKYQPILYAMLRNVIANNGKLTYIHDAFPLGLEGIEWKHFIDELSVKKAMIANYFGVPDEFRKVVMGGKYQEFHYGRKYA